MILRCYAVHDAAVGAFMTPFMARADGEAVRLFLAAVQNQKDFASNFRDYSLFFLSEWNDATGDYGVPAEEKLSVPRGVMSGVQAMDLLNKQIPLPFTPASPVDLSDEAQIGPMGLNG